MEDPLYELYYVIETILKRVIDVNSNRSVLADPRNKWIWPEIPTSTDDSYPRITIQFLNLEEMPISAGRHLFDNLKTSDSVKEIVTGKLYNVTIWIGLFVKTELKYEIERQDGQKIHVKNGLLGNLIFSNILREIDKAEAEIRAVAFGYKPFNKTFALNYEDSSKRIINAVTINIPVLSEMTTTLTADDLMETIVKNYTVS